MRNPFKTKGEYKELKNDNFFEFLRQDAFSVLGVIDCKKDTFIDRNNIHFVLYEYQYILPNNTGDYAIDVKNKDNMKNLLIMLKGEMKTFPIGMKKKPLNTIYNTFLQKYGECEDEELKEIYLDRLIYTDMFNSKKYTSSLIMIRKSDEQRFLKRAKRFLNVTKMTQDEAIEIFHRVNNPVYRGVKKDDTEIEE